MSVPKCTSWLGHKLEARYSKGASSSPAMKINSGMFAVDLIDIIDQYRPITYEGDVCTRCGALVNRKEKA